jgi:hypothetical protein
MERVTVFVGALLATILFIRLIPRLPIGKSIPESEVRPTMSPAELRFFQVLRQCIPRGYEVWPKADLSQYWPSGSESVFVDFLITYGVDQTPALIVDFDDLTPLGLKAGLDISARSLLPVTRVPMAHEYQVDLVRAQIERALALEQRKAA